MKRKMRDSNVLRAALPNTNTEGSKIEEKATSSFWVFTPIIRKHIVSRTARTSCIYSPDLVRVFPVVAYIMFWNKVVGHVSRMSCWHTYNIKHAMKLGHHCSVVTQSQRQSLALLVHCHYPLYKGLLWDCSLIWYLKQFKCLRCFFLWEELQEILQCQTLLCSVCHIVKDLLAKKFTSKRRDKGKVGQLEIRNGDQGSVTCLAAALAWASLSISQSSDNMEA